MSRSPHARAVASLHSLLADSGHSLEAVSAAVPRRWVRYGDLLLLPASCLAPGCFLSALRHRREVWQALAEALGARRVAVREGSIANDDFRSPRVSLLLGESPWVEQREHGVLYSWDVTRCMFSRGNVGEKARVAAWDCRGEVVVDLFAGIGYFSLPVAVKTGVRHLHACEWNPAAVEALRRNLQLNRVPAEVVTVHPGDNRECCPRGVAQRVLLGLLPTARMSWRTACLALDPDTGGWLHVHENVESAKSKVDADEAEEAETVSCNTRLLSAWRKFGKELKSELAAILAEQGRWQVSVRHFEFVKSYAPHVDHLVVDVLCSPVKSDAEEQEERR